jgi:hydroxypyruvate reductase
MAHDVLATAGRATDAWIDAIAQHHVVHRLTPQSDRAALLAEVAPKVRALVSGGGFTVDRALLESLPNLGLIAVTGAGYDRIDVVAAAARGVAVCNAPHATAVCVADMAMGLYLAVARRLAAGDRFVREGRWLEGRAPLVRRASGRRLGIWGLGYIGQVIARRAEGFDMEVHYHGRRERPDVPYRYQPSLLAMARAVDVLVCAVPATPETVGRVDAAVLEALGPRGILVNIARGAVVDEAALIQALRDGTIAGAGLDVFVQEPTRAEAFLDLDNVVLSPHTAGSTFETWDEVVRTILANLEAFFQDGRVLTPIPG